MPNRDQPLADFIDALNAAAFVGSLHAGRPDNASAATRKIPAALATPGTVAAVQSAQLDARRHLESALANARCSPHPIAALAEAFAPLVPNLHWRLRPPADGEDPKIRDEHANADIVGPQGLEWHDDVLGCRSRFLHSQGHKQTIRGSVRSVR